MCLEHFDSITIDIGAIPKEKQEFDNKITNTKIMPRRAENFGMLTDYRRNP